MKVTLRKSPNPEKKYRVTFEDGSHVDFGGAGYSDSVSYTHLTLPTTPYV